jgi:hypothetical protein
MIWVWYMEKVVSQALVTAPNTSGEYGHLEWKSKNNTLGFSIYKCWLGTNVEIASPAYNTFD